MVKTLLKNGVITMKGLTSKKGNKFGANLRYEKITSMNFSSRRWSLTKND